MDIPYPVYIQLYPTTKCNQRCSFCFNPKNRPPTDLSFQNALVLLDILANNDVTAIDIMGGEPCLVPWIADFVDKGLTYGMSLNISTNGSMPDMIERFKGMPIDRFNIGISLEGSAAAKHDRLTGSNNFTAAIKSIKKLVEFSLNPIVKTVLNQDTADDMQNIIDIVRLMGINRYYIIHMDILSKQNSAAKKAVDFSAFLDFYKKIKTDNPDIEVHRVNASCFDSNSLPPGVRCAGGVKKLSIMPDGSVFPCNLFHNAKEFEIGNIFRDRFSDIWTHSRLDFFRKHQKNNCHIHACENHGHCTGGCPAHGFYHYRNPDMTDIRCIQSLRRHPTTDNLRP